MGKVQAVIYLANDVTSGAFTEKRVGLLKLLAGQMAISIENALFYSELEQKVEERTNELRIEKKKSELSSREDIKHQIITRRFNSYPKLVSLIYRIRNMSRDISSNPSMVLRSFYEELTIRKKEYEELLYEMRSDLVRDQMFDSCHEYKNIVTTFSMLVADIMYLKDKNIDINLRKKEKELRITFDKLDDYQSTLIKMLSLPRND
jgi:hypothetical protein